MHEDLMVLQQQQSMLFPNQNVVAPDPFSGISPDAYSRFYSSDIRRQERKAAEAFADKAERESNRRLAGDFANDLGFGVGALIGSPLGGMVGFTAGGFAGSMLAESILNATGFFELDPLVTLGDQSRAMVDSSVHRFAFGLGGVGMDRGISMDEASTIGNNLFDQARDAGFHGVEVSRVMDTLGQYSSKLHMSSGSADDIASQLEEYLDGVMDIVKRTGDSMERASAMIAEAKTMGVGPGDAAGFYGTMSGFSSIAGINPNQMVAMGQQHAAPFASTGFGYGDIMTSFSGGMAQAGMMSANSQNAPLWAAIGGPAQYGMHQAQLGSAFVSNPRMWGKMMGEGAFDQGAWDAMRSGRAAPDSYGDAYGDMNRNDQLVAQYQGMQEIMGRSEQWTQAASGSLFQQMAEDDITDYRAQAMWLHQGGYASNIATARQDVVTHLQYNQNPDRALGSAMQVELNNQANEVIQKRSDLEDLTGVLATSGAILATHNRPLNRNDADLVENLFMRTTNQLGAPGSAERLISVANEYAGTSSVNNTQLTPEFINGFQSSNGAYSMPVAGVELALTEAGLAGNTEQVEVLSQILDQGTRYTARSHGVDYNADGSSRFGGYAIQYYGAEDNWWEKRGTDLEQLVSNAMGDLYRLGDWVDSGLNENRATAGPIGRVLGLDNLQFLYTAGNRLATDTTAMLSIDADVVDGFIDTSLSIEKELSEARHYMGTANRPTDALSMYARQSGWFDRLSPGERAGASRFGRRFNAASEAYALAESQLTTSQVNARLNMWQTPSGMDSGWEDFLNRVANTNATFDEDAGFGRAYNDFASEVYGVGGRLALSTQQEQYINTYLGVSGAGSRVNTHNLAGDLMDAARGATTSAGYESAMTNIKVHTGLRTDQINDVALYGTYRAQSAQISAELDNDNLSSARRDELIALKAEYDSSMNAMTLGDENLQRLYDQNMGMIGAIAGSEDMVIRIAGAGVLDEDMGRADDVWRRASGQMGDILRGGPVSLKQLQGMNKDEISKYIDLEAAASYDDMAGILDKINSGEALTDNDFLALQDIAEMNPDIAKDGRPETNGSSDEQSLWVRFSGASEDSLSDKIAAKMLKVIPLGIGGGETTTPAPSPGEQVLGVIGLGGN